MSSTAFVSYAQNFEDVILWRALGGIPEGFYIDVGAASPTADSVTLAFYERGWRGINVEPDPASHVDLVAKRPRDVNLNIAVSNAAGELPMYFVAHTGNSTLIADEARLREAEGRAIAVRVVPIATLDSIWQDHVPEGQEVHFLKVDVEGAEREVLEGLTWTTRRPWVVVVEATRPNTPEPSHEPWERILLDAGYELVYRDGLNRFYLAGGHDDLRAAFDAPPNYWDHFVTAAQRVAERRSIAASERARAAESRVAALESKLAAMRASLSWRLTRPLRAIGRGLRSLRRSSRQG